MMLSTVDPWFLPFHLPISRSLELEPPQAGRNRHTTPIKHKPNLRIGAPPRDFIIDNCAAKESRPHPPGHVTRSVPATLPLDGPTGADLNGLGVNVVGHGDVLQGDAQGFER